MKHKTNVSPYSMMYLVTPAIYEKLLLCIDEGDKKLLDSLNKPTNLSQDKRPAQVIIDALSTQELGQTPVVMNVTDSSAVHQLDPLPIAIPSHQEIQQNLPVSISQEPQNQVPLSVTVLPQGDNPPPVPSVVDSSSSVLVSSQQPLVTPTPVTISSQQPIVTPTPVAIKGTAQPVILSIPNTVSQPAAFSQPIKQLVTNDDIGMDYDSRGIKRPTDDSFVDPQSKKFQPTDIFHERDIQYRQGMLEREKNKKLHIDQQLNPLTRLPRDLVQWQPLQCVSNTTGGKICNSDPIQQARLIKKEIKDEKSKLKLRKDIFLRPNTCSLCGVRLGNAELLKVHKRLKHGIKESIKSETSLSMPALDEKPKVTKPKRLRFQTPGTVTPIRAFEYDPDADVSFRSKGQKLKRKRFTSAGNEPSTEPLVYDSSQDVSFRKPKTKTVAKRKRALKPTSFRCPICEVALGNLSLLKDHIALKHKMSPNDVLTELAANTFSNPQPGSSRDFSDWASIRIQPSRQTRKQRFGQLKETTKDFKHW